MGWRVRNHKPGDEHSKYQKKTIYSFAMNNIFVWMNEVDMMDEAGPLNVKLNDSHKSEGESNI